MSSEGAEASRTHERAVLEQDNGELVEDVVTKRSLDNADARSAGVDEDGIDEERIDEEGMESFPASDPPSGWSGVPDPGPEGGDG